MSEQSLRILQVSHADRGGGAADVARRLFDSYRKRGHRSWLAVGRKSGDEPGIRVIPNEEARGAWAAFWSIVADRVDREDPPLGSFLAQNAGRLAHARKIWDRFWGVEDFHFPGTWELLELFADDPDVVHCHNLHGGYFDLRALPWLSRQAPLFLTLHDAWLLSGHCAHSFECDRWKEGCGQCPDLSIYPAVRRDATAYNWKRKAELYSRCRLHVVTPCEWLMDRVEQSMLAPAVMESRVIPNGIDLTIFEPGDREQVRDRLSIPQQAMVILFTARGIRDKPWRDFQEMRSVVRHVANRFPEREVLFLALGEDAPDERHERVQVRFIPFQREARDVARYYQAADMYLHLARADTFPTSVLEALACGTPVVASAVGGIPEQIKSLPLAECPADECADRGHSSEEATGVLVPSQSADAATESSVRLLEDESLRKVLARNARVDARRRYDVRDQVSRYLQLYRAVLESKRAAVRAHA